MKVIYYTELLYIITFGSSIAIRSVLPSKPKLMKFHFKIVILVFSFSSHIFYSPFYLHTRWYNSKSDNVSKLGDESNKKWKWSLKSIFSQSWKKIIHVPRLIEISPGQISSVMDQRCDKAQ